MNSGLKLAMYKLKSSPREVRYSTTFLSSSIHLHLLRKSNCYQVQQVFSGDNRYSSEQLGQTSGGRTRLRLALEDIPTERIKGEEG